MSKLPIPIPPTPGQPEPKPCAKSCVDELPTHITLYQRAAINGILEKCGMKYEDLAKEVLGKPIPLEDLSYEEARVIIQCGNELVRQQR